MKYTRDEIRRAMLLYAVTDSHWLKEGQTLADVTAEVVKSGVTFLQIREKDLAPEAFEAEAEALKKLCNAAGVPFVVNDSVEIALACDADGVHVGQSDIRGRDIRAIIGRDKILGITANTVERAVAAEKAGADYIGVGAMFATGTKKNAVNIPISRLQDIVITAFVDELHRSAREHLECPWIDTVAAVAMQVQADFRTMVNCRDFF